MRKSLSGLAAVGLVLALAACGSDSESTGVKANMGATVGIAMPTKTSARWLNDGEQMVAQFESMGYKTDLKYGEDKAETQVAQVEKMIADGDKLLVIAAVDGGAMVDVLAEAAKKNIKVIAYDRLLMKTRDVNYQATFDNRRVGRMQGQLLLDRLGISSGDEGPFNIEMFAGAATDANAKSFYDGSMDVLKKYLDNGTLVVPSKKTAFLDIDTDKYSGALAYERMNQVLAQFYENKKLDAVLSPYDGMSRGIIISLTENGFTRAGAKKMPVISGQDAELDSVKDVKDGYQTATIYKDTRELAKVAVQMGNALLTGQKPQVNDTTTYDNAVKKVPTYLLYPVQVDAKNYQKLLLDGGYYTKKQLAGKSRDVKDYSGA